MPKGEISTNAIVRDALSQHKKVFVPYTHQVSDAPTGQPSAVMDMVSLHSVEDYEALQTDNWGIPTPSKDSLDGRENCLKKMGGVGADVSEAGLDLIVMPGMAFDEDLNRLGHGRGFYDFFLKRYQDSTRQEAPIKPKMPFLGESIIPGTFDRRTPLITSVF